MKIVPQVPGVFFSFWIYCRANVATLRMLKNLHRNFFTRFIHSEFLGVNHLQKSIFFAFSRFSPGLVQILIGNWPYCKKDNSRLFVLPLIIVTYDCGIQSFTEHGFVCKIYENNSLATSREGAKHFRGLLISRVTLIIKNQEFL